jgi:hypothetical protein
MQGSKWGAPFWIGATRLVGHDAKMVSWHGRPRPTCKQYDSEAKVKKFLVQSNNTNNFREQRFIQNMLPNCQATSPKHNLKPTTTSKPDSKKKTGSSKSSSASGDMASGVSSLLALVGTDAEGAANSMGQLEPYNSQASAASLYVPPPGQGSGSDIQNQFNLFMIGQQRETQSQLLQMQQQLPSPCSRSRGRQQGQQQLQRRRQQL